MGYGSRALQALNSFYSGEYFNLDESSSKLETDYPDPSAIDPVCSPFLYPCLPLNGTSHSSQPISSPKHLQFEHRMPCLLYFNG